MDSRVAWSGAFVIVCMALGYAVFSYAIPLLNANSDALVVTGVLTLLVVWPLVFILVFGLVRSIWRKPR